MPNNLDRNRREAIALSAYIAGSLDEQEVCSMLRWTRETFQEQLDRISDLSGEYEQLVADICKVTKP